MISLAPGTKVYLASKPVSMRLGFDGLAALVRPLFAVEPHAQVLLPRRQRLGFGFVVRFVVETRVGRIDHPEP